MTLSSIITDGGIFRDLHGRHVILRGVNLGGDCKVPYPDGGTQYPSDFSDHRTVSFVGRPFPLAQAQEHFERLKGWGFNCLRLLTTWEAVEHAGPGLYDIDYLDYFTEIARLAGEAGFSLFVDFHQDAWSRMSGGDGAPGWTFEEVGLDFTRFAAAGAALVMQAAYDYADPEPHQDAYPQMGWSGNYRLPANTIMWTLFWAGALVTPDFMIGGVNVQHFLQRHYLGAMEQVAQRLSGMPHVIGFDTLNEPGTGWIGDRLTHRQVTQTADGPTLLRPGPVLSPLDGLAIARGLPVEVPVLARDGKGGCVAAHSTVLNPGRAVLWQNSRDCPFEAAGIYRMQGDQPIPCREDVFTHHAGRPLSIGEDGYGPFFDRVATTVRRHRSDWLIFAEIDPYGPYLGRRFPAAMPDGWVMANHWYDTALLHMKTFDPLSSRDFATGAPDRNIEGVRDRYIRQLKAFADLANERGVPALLGEFGTPFDLEEGEAYRLWRAGCRDPAIWEKQATALGLMYDALDTHLLNSTQWNYTASNRNDLRVGDGWNQEDLSIYSVDQRDGEHDGGRALEGFCRPYVRRAQGRLLTVDFNSEQRLFQVRILADSSIRVPTEIYVPEVWFPAGFQVNCSSSPVEVVRERQVVRILVLTSGQVEIDITAGDREAP